jgi:hypothetical protein
MYAYHEELKILVTLSILMILVLRDDWIFSGYKVFIPANPQSNNAVET